MGLGVGVTLLAGSAMKSVFFGVSWAGPLSVAFVATVLVAVAACASWLPSHRVLRVDPITASKTDGQL